MYNFDLEVSNIDLEKVRLTIFCLITAQLCVLRYSSGYYLTQIGRKCDNCPPSGNTLLP